MSIALPKMVRIRQDYAPTSLHDIKGEIEVEFGKLAPRIKRNQSIAVGVGSRGISNLQEIVSQVIRQLRLLGAVPFIVPAMGSHGGATPEGQIEVLASYGITDESMGVPIRASMDVVCLPDTEDGVNVVCSREALNSDGILLVNRIKPHTDFFGTLGSGLIKMTVIGLGKRVGATHMHLAATKLGYEHVIRSMARVIWNHAPLLGGIAIIENQRHETAKLVAVDRENLLSAEDQLLPDAKSLMPSLPFEEIDLLIVDFIGKNISGAGLDPNIINRDIHGYSSLPMRGKHTAPFIRRIFVRGLTSETYGNAIGIGLADATTNRLVQSMDREKTNINSLTALTPQSAKIPIAFASDREAIERMLCSLPLGNYAEAKIARIVDTLSLTELTVSESLWEEVRLNTQVIKLSDPNDFEFDSDGNLT